MKKFIPLFVFCAVASTGILMAQDNANFLAGEKAYAAGNYAAAVENYTRYIQTFSGDVPAYLTKQHSYDTSNAFEKASLFANFTIHHDWAVAYYKRGMADLKNNSYDGAQKDFDAAIQIDRKYAEPYYQKGLLIKGTDKNLSCQYINKALMLGDTDRMAKRTFSDNFCWMCAIDYYTKGKTEVDTKDYAEALKNLNMAISYCYDSANYFAYRGMAYEGLGELDSALADYTHAIKMDSNSYMGYYRRALDYEKAQKYKEAFDDLNKAILLNPKFGDAYLHQAGDCENLNMSSGALYDYQQVLRLKPNAGIAWYKIGLIRQQNGQESCSYFEKAVELGCDDAQSYADDCKKEEERKALK